MSDDNTSGTAPQAPAKKKPLALGRGLGALLGETRREEPLVNPASLPRAGGVTSNDGLAVLPVASIIPHPGQPRRHFDEAALDELAASIAARVHSSHGCSSCVQPFNASATISSRRSIACSKDNSVVFVLLMGLDSGRALSGVRQWWQAGLRL